MDLSSDHKSRHFDMSGDRYGDFLAELVLQLGASGIIKSLGTSSPLGAGENVI